MSYYVCQLIENNVCTTWVLHSDPSFLPPLTIEEGNQIGFACLLVMATVFVIRMCIKTLNR